MQARKVFKNNKAKRFVAEAVRHFAAKDYEQTSRSLHAALEANPSCLEAINLMGDLCDTIGSPSAIEWRIRSSNLQPTDMTKRLDWAQTAVKFRDLKSVEEALSG